MFDCEFVREYREYDWCYPNFSIFHTRFLCKYSNVYTFPIKFNAEIPPPQISTSVTSSGSLKQKCAIKTIIITISDLQIHPFFVRLLPGGALLPPPPSSSPPCFPITLIPYSAGPFSHSNQPPHAHGICAKDIIILPLNKNHKRKSFHFPICVVGFSSPFFFYCIFYALTRTVAPPVLILCIRNALQKIQRYKIYIKGI